MVEVAPKTSVSQKPALAIPIAVNGGEAVAYAMKQIEPEVVAAYPITPQTLIIEKFAEYVAEGAVRTEFISVESEHAALSAVVGASTAGARAVTATAGPGLALMFEILAVTSGMRLPIVMHLCTRSLSAPLNILSDHSDAMAMREQSWIMLAGASPQEAYDQSIMAHLIGEPPEILLPVTNMVDGFVVTHSVERVDTLSDEVVRAFVGEYEPEESVLHPGSSVTFGALDFRDFYFEHKRQQQAALDRSLGVVEDVLDRFADISGRRYGTIEPYRLDDADIAMVFLGSAEGVIRRAVDDMRDQGVKAGALRIRLFRPFPTKAVQDALAGVNVVGVADRAMAFGAPTNPLMLDLATTLYGTPKPPILKDFVYGLGGRNTAQGLFKSAFEQLVEAMDSSETIQETGYLGLRQVEL